LGEPVEDLGEPRLDDTGLVGRVWWSCSLTANGPTHLTVRRLAGRWRRRLAAILLADTAGRRRTDQR
jgi:hypothetical protein